MADKSENNIRFKALVDKESNKVIFIETDNVDFIDALFSFLTIPMGTIIKLGRNSSHSSTPVKIGCMNNLYSSVESMDGHYFRGEGCKTMLLCPRNGSESLCKHLKLRIDGNGEPKRYFLCPSCISCKLLSHYKDVLCSCGLSMNHEKELIALRESKKIQAGGGVFFKVPTRLIISEGFRVMRPLESFALFMKLGLSDVNAAEVVTCSMGIAEVLNLLICSLVSKTPLTETLLKHKPAPKSKNENRNCRQTSIDTKVVGDTMKVNLLISKSKKMVCYAEAGEDFVDLIFSFLTLPLGFILKQMSTGDCSNNFKGCIDQLFKSVHDLNEQYLKSNYQKEILLSPRLYPGFCYKNHILGIKEGPEASYYYAKCPEGLLYYAKIHDNSSSDSPNCSNRPVKESTDMLTTDKYLIPVHFERTGHLKFKDEKSAQGFVKRQTMFTISDSLIIRPISPISPIYGFSILNELNVPLSDIKEEVVQVGKEEALRLLMASFLGDTALTDTFMTHSTSSNFSFAQA